MPLISALLNLIKKQMESNAQLGVPAIIEDLKGVETLKVLQT